MVHGMLVFTCTTALPIPFAAFQKKKEEGRKIYRSLSLSRNGSDDDVVVLIVNMVNLK